PMAAAEYSVIKTYLEWLIGLPWQVVTEDNLDIARASEVLEEDHYDLEKIKERILEYLAVRKLRKERADEFKREETHDYLRLEREGAILCFVGPPGTGKTSLGRSIARALGRKFVRMSLGGMRDEAEIRGHRRTYIGAMPGRVIQALKRAGSKNPVFMLDEVDKVGNDWRGDPTSALLEVLDPEQNRDYRDHYLDVPFDLSEVMFITTANQLEPIPLPLRDRMEIIQLSGYTEEEKIKIAQGYLIPRQRRENALRDGEVDFTVPALQKIVRDFTREAGVRNLEQQIGNICRKVVTRVARAAADDAALELIEPDKVVEYLGKPRYFFEAAERTEVPGVATGLSWTPTGGDIIFIEATKMKGNKGLLLTGQLGDVMKESAQAALSYVRSKAAAHGLSESFFDTADLHVHVPAGAIPKDGPSAGVTLATAILSLLTGRSVRANVAMTGEITLRGQVLPIGGLKEKILAARRAGLDTVILPKRNEPDLDDLPADVRQEMHFVLVETLDQVFAAALKETDAAGAAEPAGAAGAEAAATEGA
ncbi:MAG: endopeptidase La, partial [Chloroflexi bacterium]|nr:endopeptidase La [Chloroflexota bacterium]